MLLLVLLACPAALFVAAALAHWQRGPRGQREALALLAVLGGLAGAGAVEALAWRAGPSGVAAVLLPWSRSVFDTSVSVSATPLTGAVLLLIGALGLMVALYAHSIGETECAAPALAATGAASLFVLGAANPLGLLFSWLLLDIVLFFIAGRNRAGLLAGQLGLLFAVAAMVPLPWPVSGAAGASLLAYSGLGSAGRFWLLSAAAIRMGLFPVWWAVPATDRRRPWTSLGTRLAPIAAGGYLVLLSSALAPLGAGLTPPSLLPTVASMLGASALAWLAGNASESMDWQTSAQAALLLLAALIGGQVGQAVGLLVLVDLVLVRAGLLQSELPPGGVLGRAARWVLALAAAGVPPTLGFAGRWLLYRELLFSGLVGGLVAVVLATGVCTARLWDALRLRAPGGPRTRWIVVALTALAVLELALGTSLPALGPVLGRLAGTSLPSPLVDARAGLTSRATFLNALVLAVAVLLPAASALVVRPDPRRASDARRREVRRALRLTRAVTAASALFVRTGELLHRVTGLLESRRAMAWTVMAATVTASAMVVGPPGPGAAQRPERLLGASVFVLAALIGAAMVLARSPGLMVGALGGAYVLAAAIQWLSGVPPQIALIELVGGLLAAMILGVGALQAPIDRRLVGAARRLAAVGASAGDRGGRALPALALFVALLLSYGMHSTVMGQVLPPQVLRPAFGLVTSGVLAAVFSRSPLRLAAGVLVTLAGFDIAYAVLDPGLLITGGLAAFQLLFAVIASYYVAMPAEEAVAQ